MHREINSTFLTSGGVFVLLPFTRFDVEELETRARAVMPAGHVPRRGKSDERYFSHLAGRTALAEALRIRGETCEVRPDPEFGFLRVFDEEGERSDLFANVSHTRGVAAAVVMSTPVGIDVERADRSVERVAERMATPDELVQMEQPVDVVHGTVPRGVLLWSAKEAVSKATGLGLKFGLQNFVIDLRSPRPFSVTIHRSGPLELSDPGVEAFRYDDFVVTICAGRGQLGRGLKEIVL